ncbi:hypothetical protein MAP00_007901 [Monascus purpureus]|nr:hypothetical protein MAP00_007901 [Monascus purpureus]
MMSSFHTPANHNAYLTEQMHQGASNYGWASRQPYNLQPSVAVTGQSLPHPQPVPSPSFPSRYDNNAFQSSHLQGYYPQTGFSQHYPSSQSPGRVYQPRRAPVIPSVPSNTLLSNPPSFPEQQMLHSSPSYVLNHSEYYLPESSLPQPISPHRVSVPASSHAPSLPTPETVYSSPEPAPTSSEPERQIPVTSSRPRPQCWDHGCNGREFSTFSNLLRHQREKSGVIAKAECPICGAVFTRTTARNIHVAQGKCKSTGREAPVG